MFRCGRTQTGAGLLVSVVYALIYVTFVSCHPQCLDSRPPFEAETQLTFCPDYASFGCCTGKDDTLLYERYQRMRQEIISNNTALWDTCSAYVKTFVCQRCSPYAAHIFDSEISTFGSKVEPRSFPGLCNGYCTNFYSQCKDIVRLFLDEAGSTERNNLEEGLQQGMSSFCNRVGLSDVDYCYPELLTNSVLLGNITLEAVTKPGCLCVEVFQNNTLRNPIFLKHANDGSGRMFIGEQIGVVHIFYPDGTKLPEPFVDIRADIMTTSSKGDERGMLGMAFHPKYTENGKFYIYYSTHLAVGDPYTNDHKIRIEEFKVSETNPNEVDYGYSRIILEVPEPFWNHNGGEILFGLDNYMYLFVGDGGKAGDPLESGQDLNSLLGKVLRIDVDTVDHTARTEYSIPTDNPFADGQQGRPEIYAYGVRNIWRCGLDRGDRETGYGRGRIVCGDVGQSKREEVDLIEKGANYGWNIKEGNIGYCTNCNKALPTDVLTPPIFDYNHTVGKSVTGGHFYRGCESPNLNGLYIFGDFMTGKLFRLKEDPETKAWDHEVMNMCDIDRCTPPLSKLYSPRIISFGEDEAGEIFMLSTSIARTDLPQGSVYKLVDPSRRGNPTLCKKVQDTTPATGNPTAASTTPKTASPTQPHTTQQPIPKTTLKTTSGSPAVFVSGVRLMNYLDYYKKEALRRKRKKLQLVLKDEKREREKHLVGHRGHPPPRDGSPSLSIQGISVKRCTSLPKFWCSLKRFDP